MDSKSQMKLLPSVEKVLEDNRIAGRLTLFSRRGVTRLVRERIAGYRQRIMEGELAVCDDASLRSSIIGDVLRDIERVASRQRRVINATGVVLHTNLGRAVLGRETCSAVELAASGYVDMEMDLATGDRVGRSRRVTRLLCLITGVEDALVVNNNAAAVFLAVQTLAGSGGVAVSRGELVEIGGSFRLPEILSAAAGRVIEVGTTNRTHIKDYERSIEEGATLLLKVHASNYRIIGYTNEVSLPELAELGRARNVPVLYDQGSGVLYPLHLEGVEGEESIDQVLSCGVDLVCFSADKVLGAPQGGILIGSSHLIERMRRNHLSRALRVDKLTLAGLEQVLLHYWRGEFDRIPALRMITESVESLRERAERFAASLSDGSPRTVGVSVTEGESSIGGGSYPINPLPSALVAITMPSGLAGEFACSLRTFDPAILVRVKEDTIFLDLRTVSENEERMLMDGLRTGIGDFTGRE